MKGCFLTAKKQRKQEHLTSQSIRISRDNVYNCSIQYRITAQTFFKQLQLQKHVPHTHLYVCTYFIARLDDSYRQHKDPCNSTGPAP